MASPWLRESCHAIVAKSKAPGVRFRSLAVAKSLKWEAGTRADQRPERPDPLRDFEFSPPHFQISGAARQNMYKKEGRCAGPTPRFQALPSGHLCRGLFSSIFRVKFATTRKNFFLYTVKKQNFFVLCCPSFHPFPLPSVPSYRGNFWRF